MFSLEHISKSYKSKNVLDDISISAKKGEAIGILGSNGAGKSTLLSTIASTYKQNQDVRIGYIPQENPLFDELKPIDNIKMWCAYSKNEILKKLSSEPLSKLEITSFLDVPVKNMSGGMKKRLSLATVLISEPNVLLMDEPFAALDLPAKQDILSYMKFFLDNDGIIIAASHDENIFEFCKTVYLLKNGKLHNTEHLKAKGISYIDMLRS